MHCHDIPLTVSEVADALPEQVYSSPIEVLEFQI